MSGSSTMTFKQGIPECIVWMSHGVDLAAVKRFAQKLQPYTHADISLVTHTVGEYVTLPGQGGDVSIALYAHIFLRRRADLKVYAFKLRAPTANVFDQYQEVTLPFGNSFAQWYSDMAGELFDFEHGALCGSTK